MTKCRQIRRSADVPTPVRDSPESTKRGQAQKLNKGKRTPRRRKSRKALRLKADKLFSLAVRERDGNQCRVCGSIKQMTCGHLVSRGYMATRWDFSNAVGQCWSCNCKAKFDSIWWEDWIEERFPGRLKLLKVKARQGIKTVDLEGVVEALEGQKGDAG